MDNLKKPDDIIEVTQNVAPDMLIAAMMPPTSMSLPSIAPPNIDDKLKNILLGAYDSNKDLSESAPPLEKKHGSKMKEADKVNFVVQHRTLSADSRKTAEAAWQENWNLYHLYKDYSDKADWQSKIVLPRIFYMVENGATTFRRALLSVKDWFAVDYNYDEENQVNFLRNYLQFLLDENNFPGYFETAIKLGLLSYLLTAKVNWERSVSYNIQDDGSFDPEEEENLVLLNIDPANLYLDPSGNDRWKIEKEVIPLEEFRKRVRDPRYGYKKSCLEDIVSDFRDAKEEEEDREKRDQTPVVSSEYDKQVYLYHYWGDLYDENGDIIYENIWFIIANDKYLVKDVAPNPYWDRTDPYVVAGLIDVPLSVYNKSFVAQARQLSNGLNELLNLMIDAFTMGLLKSYELDVDIIQDTDQIAEGFVPGKIWLKEGQGNPQTQLIKEVLDISVSPQIWNLYQSMDREMQYVGVTDALGGVPRMRGRVSALEMMQKSTETNSYFDGLSRSIETNFLNKLLKKIALTGLQYQKFWQSSYILKKVFGGNEDFRNKFVELTPPQRFNMFRKANFKVQGLSIVLARIQEVDKLMMLLRTMANLPDLTKRIKWNKLGCKLFESLNWDSSELLYSEEEVQVMMQQQQQQMMQQQMQQAMIAQQAGGQAAAPPQASSQEKLPQGRPPGGSRQVAQQAAIPLGQPTFS